MSIPARSFTMNTIQIVKNIFTQTTHSNVKVGRWGVGTHSKSGLIVDYSNEDHCGVCSGYANEIQMKNKKKEELSKEEERLNEEFVWMLGTTADAIKKK